MKQLILSLLILMSAACTSTAVFTAAERERIGTDPGAGIMRLWTIDRPDDSLLLRRAARPLTRDEAASPYVAVLAARMLATVLDPTNPGVGIAAPQVGISRRMVLVQRLDQEGEPFVCYINPVIESHSDLAATGPEGCLSVPGKRGLVRRSVEVVVRYTDPATWTERRDTVGGFTAVIFQHEIDHLDGRLYIDRADTVTDDTDEDAAANAPSGAAGEAATGHTGGGQ